MKSIVKSLPLDLVNPNIVKMGFIRDPLVYRANDIVEELKQVK